MWRSAAARLQHRPKSGTQRDSIAQGRARPGEDEGLLGVRVPAGSLSRLHSPHRVRLWPLRPATPPFEPAPPATPPRPRPARRAAAAGLGGWGAGGGGGGAGEQSGTRAFAVTRVPGAARPLACGGACGPAGLCRALSGVGRRDPTARAGPRTRGAGPGCTRGAPILLGAGVRRLRQGPRLCRARRPRLGRPRSLSPPARLSRTLRPAAPPHTRGCLFLLGLSMLSLFGRWCHRLDAGNKVRPCVIECVTCAAGLRAPLPISASEKEGRAGSCVPGEGFFLASSWPKGTSDMFVSARARVGANTRVYRTNGL